MLTLQFVPYFEIAHLTSEARIQKLLNMVKDEKIVMLEGRLKKEEEAKLIHQTMAEIDENFSGIELQVVDPDIREDDIIYKIKKNIASILLGDRQGMTIIGPANIIKEIKRDPDKIQLLTKELNASKKKTKKEVKKKSHKKK